MGWVRGAVRAWSRASGAPASAGFSGCPCGALLCLPVSSCMHGRCCVAVPELLLALPMCQGAAGIPALLQGHRGRSKPTAVGPAVPGPSQCTSANPLGRSSGVQRGCWPKPPWAPGGSPVCWVGQQLLHGTSWRAQGHAPSSAGTLLGGWCQAVARCGMQLCGTWSARAV